MTEENSEVVEDFGLDEGVEDELRSRYGKLVSITVEPFGTFVFHRLSKAANDLMTNKISDTFEKMQAVQEGVLTCLCFPISESNGQPNHKLCREVFAQIPEAPQQIMLEIKTLPAALNIKKR